MCFHNRYFHIKNVKFHLKNPKDKEPYPKTEISQKPVKVLLP